MRAVRWPAKGTAVTTTADGWPTRTFRAMGSDACVIVEPGAGADTLLDRLEAEIHTVEAVCSRFRADSDLCRLNAAGSAEVPDVLADMVRAALDAAGATGGLYDPTCLGALERIGYDDTFAAVRDRVHVVPVRPVVRSDHRLVTVRGNEVTLPRGCRLDLGGIGKGWTADRCIALAASLAPGRGVLVDIGGDIAVAAPGPYDGTWPLGVTHGPDDDDLLGTVLLASGALTTSTVTRRRWTSDRGDQHHVVDPRTGDAARTDLTSVTVTVRTAALSEVWSKALLIAGILAAPDLAADAGVEFVATGVRGSVVTNAEVFASMPPPEPDERPPSNLRPALA